MQRPLPDVPLPIGVRHFKTFLDYAERGPLAIAEAVTRAGTADFESGFEQAVCQALTGRGFEIDTQVGCAGYRIDLAVRDPSKPGRYLLGIECDGASYHSAKTARDRDRLRQAVLESLGWRIHRVWSTEWWVNPERCLQSLDQAIESARIAAAAPACERAEPRGPSDAGTNSSRPDTPASSGAFMSSPGAPRERSAPAGPAKRASEPEHPAYRGAKPGSSLASLDIFDEAATSRAIDAIGRIIDAEGPVHEELVARRLASWCDVQRVTDRFRARFSRLLDRALTSGRTADEHRVLWPGGRSEANYTGLRGPGEADEDRREFELIPLAERVNAVMFVLGQQFGLPRQDLEREAAAIFGVLRLSARARHLVGDAIDRAVASGKAIERDGRVSVKG